MSWVDLTSIILDLLTLVFVIRATREIKNSLTDARHERLDINRRIEVITRRFDRQSPPAAEAEAEPTLKETAP